MSEPSPPATETPATETPATETPATETPAAETIVVDGYPVAYLARPHPDSPHAAGPRPDSPHAAGPRPAMPLLLVHGFTGSKEDFTAVVDALAEDRRVVAIDLPGHGASPGPDDERAYTLPGLANWVVGAADALGFERFHLLGHSLGGLVAQQVAATASARLGGLVLASTGVGAPPDEVIDGLVAIARAVRSGGLGAGLAERKRLDAERPAKPVDPERDAFTERRFLAMAPEAVIGTASALATAAPNGAALRGLDVPALVVHGDDEDIWPEPAQRLLGDTAAGARRVVVPGAHSPQLDVPDVWAREVRAFLRLADGLVYRDGSAPEYTRRTHSA